MSSVELTVQMKKKINANEELIRRVRKLSLDELILFIFFKYKEVFPQRHPTHSLKNKQTNKPTTTTKNPKQIKKRKKKLCQSDKNDNSCCLP